VLQGFMRAARFTLSHFPRFRPRRKGAWRGSGGLPALFRTIQKRRAKRAADRQGKTPRRLRPIKRAHRPHGTKPKGAPPKFQP
jgi:hypothetical protein